MPGFDGKRGCEGCVEDVRRIRELTHYLGYEPVTLEPLLNERATRSRVIALLSTIASSEYGIKKEDIFFLYLTCHGRTFGGGIDSRPDCLFGELETPSGSSASVNMFLLHDQPILNTEIWEPFLQWALRSDGESPRIFTVVDACHAGLGLDYVAAYLDRIVSDIISLILRLIGSVQVKGGRASATVTELNRLKGDLENIQAMPVPAQLNALKSVSRALQSLISEKGLRVVHFGAARDELTALGGVHGSLFSRRLRQLYLNGGYEMNYKKFFEDLCGLVPLRHTPVFSVFPNSTQLAEDHFALKEEVFQIQPCIEQCIPNPKSH
jgi:hypothetical protein